jgi:hypothetical protein
MIVFSVPVQRKFEGSQLFKANARRGTYASCQPVWIVAQGPDVQERLPTGTRGFIADNFELEPSDLNMWAELKDRPEFKDIREFVELVDGEVTTQIISESSLLAVED